MTRILAPISVGELLDKISILEIKIKFAQDPAKLQNIKTELEELTALKPEMSDSVKELYTELKEVNLELWEIEDFKRACEKSQNFGEEFVAAARKVYLRNDHRAAVKKSINKLTGSHIVEEKIY